MKKVLFVCVHNSGRSQMAEALFNQMAKGKAFALSAGTQPSEEVNPLVVQAITEVGIDISHNKPKKLTLEIIEGVDRMITMGCGAETSCPANFVETEDWNLEDPKGKSLNEIRKIRDDIKVRVTKLLKDMALAQDQEYKPTEKRSYS